MDVDYRMCSNTLCELCVSHCYPKGPRDEPQWTIDVSFFIVGQIMCLHLSQSIWVVVYGMWIVTLLMPVRQHNSISRNTCHFSLVTAEVRGTLVTGCWLSGKGIPGGCMGFCTR